MSAHKPWKKIIKGLTPPLVIRMLKPRGGLGFQGDYPTWQAAQADCSGYDQPSILEKVSAATQAVVDGRAVFERDSVLFDKPDYNWPLLAVLQRIAAECENRLQLIDFGGSLGSSYRQCRGFFPPTTAVRWNVVEQPAFVARGRERFETAELNFFPDMAACLAASPVPCLLLSSVLQYLESPYEFLAQTLKSGFTYVVVDRTPLSVTGRDRIVKQVVPPEIYAASYPARILDRQKLLAVFADDYDLVAEFPTLDGFDDKAEFRGFFFSRRRR
jgi:putative methyltransferase (TIGR04325 family)